jgi:transcriptional regulator with XRE-family HTH domain
VDVTRTTGPARVELAEFLRNRRARRQPADVGISTLGQRRTPGLRREEVATLAGISATWYTWLEQAREIGVSRNVLARLSGVLGLDPAERAHVFRLAGHMPPVRETPPPSECGAPHQMLLAQLDPNPAVLTNRRLDVIAWNRGYELLCGDLGSLPRSDRNLLWLTFMDPRVRALSTQWETEASAILGQFRDRLGDRVAEPATRALVARLQEASADFRRLWQAMAVAPSRPRRRPIVHPRLGRIELETMELAVSDGGGVTVIASLAPPGSALAERLSALLAETDSGGVGLGGAPPRRGGDVVAEYRRHDAVVVGCEEREVPAPEQYHPAVGAGVLDPA